MTDFLVQMCATLLKTKHFQLVVAKVINNNVEAWKMTELNLWKKSTVQSAVSSISLVRTSVETASHRNLSLSDLDEMIPSKF